MRRVFSLIIVCTLLTVSTSVFARDMFNRYLCDNPDYFCTRVQSGESWETLFTDPSVRAIVMQVNRMNVSIYPGMIIAIPKNLANGEFNDFSPMPRQIEPGEKRLIFDPKLGAWAAYDADGQLVRWGAASGGNDWCADIGQRCHTSSGTFRVYSKGDADCFSRKFPMPNGGAPMPYCMFFSGGQALHGSDAVVGYNASHGCVRLLTTDAYWLSSSFIDIGTPVIVKPYNSSEEDIEREKLTQSF